MTKIQENVNIQFIATQAGVSKATVSRILNGSQLVRPETRDRVMEIIEKYHYTPSALAQGLSRRESSSVGIIVPEISNPFFANIIKGVTEIADMHNLSLFCFDSNEEMEKDIRAINMFKSQRVCGLLYTSATSYSTPEEQRKLLEAMEGFDKPIILLDRKLDFLNRNGVYFNDYKSVYRATSILIEKGHRRIASINAPLDKILAAPRQKGYEQALRDHGIPVDPCLEFFSGYTEKDGYESTRQMLAMENRPTAVITCNNSISKGFIRALIERGLRLPEDMACIGLDRVIEVEIVGIPFNYIERDSYHMGVAGMKKLLDGSDHQDTYFDSNIVIHAL